MYVAAGWREALESFNIRLVQADSRVSWHLSQPSAELSDRDVARSFLH